MKVDDYFAQVEELIPRFGMTKFSTGLSEAAVRECIDRRIQRFRDFAIIEEGKGFLQPEMDLATTFGQEGLRILWSRGNEELLEAYYASSLIHKYEEVIDAFNYYLSMCILDPKLPKEHIVRAMREGSQWSVRLRMDRASRPGPHPNIKHSVWQILCYAHPLLELLRNRSWMNNAQSPYFDGYVILLRFLEWTTAELVQIFPDIFEFVKFYLAKDEVLNFRLESKY